MPKIFELTSTPLSKLIHIDALLMSSPDWNYFQPTVANTLFYSFSLRAQSDTDVQNRTMFSPMQQYYAKLALAEVTKYTGIQFQEILDAGQAQIVLCNADITLSANTAGLASWMYDYTPLPNLEFINYEVEGTLYLDSKEFASVNSNLTPGTRGYETLLHELGHLIGLKHPHESDGDNSYVLPEGQDGTFYTVMSYNPLSAPGATFAQYDIAALRWLYGGDGLGGTYGIGGAGGVYLTGTPFADTLTGTAYGDKFESGLGDDTINGGGGLDFLYLNVPRYLLTVTRNAQGFSVNDGESTDQLLGVERIVFAGGTYALDIEGVGGQAYRIYNAVLNRVPDSAGLGFWIKAMDSGTSLRDVAAHFMQGDEFKTNFGVNLSNSQLVTTLYQNILDRAPEQAGVDYWVGALDSGVISQAEALAMISESTENRGKVDPTISNGFVYEPWA